VVALRVKVYPVEGRQREKCVPLGGTAEGEMCSPWRDGRGRNVKSYSSLWIVRKKLSRGMDLKI